MRYKKAQNFSEIENKPHQSKQNFSIPGKKSSLFLAGKHTNFPPQTESNVGLAKLFPAIVHALISNLIFHSQSGYIITRLVLPGCWGLVADAAADVIFRKTVSELREEFCCSEHFCYGMLSGRLVCFFSVVWFVILLGYVFFFVLRVALLSWIRAKYTTTTCVIGRHSIWNQGHAIMFKNVFFSLVLFFKFFVYVFSLFWRQLNCDFVIFSSSFLVDNIYKFVEEYPL